MEIKEITLENYKLKGYSRAAKNTGFQIYPLGIFLDAGIEFENIPKLILITHGHLDHIKMLYPLTCLNDDVTILSPFAYTNFIRNYLLSCKNLTCCKKTNLENNNIFGMQNDSKYVFIKDKWEIKTYPMDHGVDCLGYGIFQIKKKIKEEFKSYNKEQILELKKQNIIFTNRISQGFLFFGGDTSKKSLSKLPINHFKYFMIECTFILDEDYQQTKIKKHLHYQDLLPYIKSNEETTFILFHFCKKYTDRFLQKFELEQKEKGINNIILWI